MNQAPRPAFFVRLACLCANRFGLRLRALVENFVQLVGKMPSPVRSGELEAYAALRALRPGAGVPAAQLGPPGPYAGSAALRALSGPAAAGQLLKRTNLVLGPARV